MQSDDQGHASELPARSRPCTPISSLLAMHSYQYVRSRPCYSFHVHTLAFNLVFVSSSAQVIGCLRPGLALLHRTLWRIQGSNTRLVPPSLLEGWRPYARTFTDRVRLRPWLPTGIAWSKIQFPYLLQSLNKRDLPQCKQKGKKNH